MKTLRILALTTLLAATGIVPAMAGFEQADTIVSTLRKQGGQRVELHLKSGAKIAGKLEVVGDRAVHITALTGMELYEAVISLDEICGVVVRTAAK